MQAAQGIEVSQADVIQAALIELEKRYPPVAAAKGRPQKRPAGGMGRRIDSLSLDV